MAATHTEAEVPRLWHGTFIQSLSPDEVDIILNGLLVLSEEGKIIRLQRDVLPDQIERILSSLPPSVPRFPVRILKRGEFLIPGFVDTHNHATQWMQRGTGRGLEIIDWLDKVTFPHEAKFDNVDYARKHYPKCVTGTIRQGVTLAAYYASLDPEAAKILVDVCNDKGQRALVGKCNMVENAPDFCADASTGDSVRRTTEFLSYFSNGERGLVRPVVSPRFAINCDARLLAELGRIAEREKAMVQTHFIESTQELAVTKKLFPQFDNEADLYEHYGLFNARTIMAHCVHPTDYVLERMKTVGIGIAHCPIGNAAGGEWGAAPIRKYLDHKISKIGLGTDSGGGFSCSILETSRQAYITSNVLQTTTGDRALTLSECFYFATLGGVRVCGLEDIVGTFEVGKEFDALHITMLEGIATEIEEEDGPETIFEKFLMTGDDRNIANVFVRGRSIKT